MISDVLGALVGPLVPALGRTILYSLWQVTVALVLTAAVLALLKRATANVRYVIACAGLVLALALPSVTFVALARPGAGPGPAGSASAGGSGLPGADPVRALPVVVPTPTRAPTSATRVELASEARLRWLVAAWALGVLLFSARLLGGWWSVARLARRRVAEPSEEWRQLFERVVARMAMRRVVRVLESAAVTVPTVIGWLRPVVLLPVAALAGLTPGQVEAIVAHELAHVRRHDYLVNLFQSFVETILFYHPGTWWLSARIRTEREHCCDDVAVAVLGDPIVYARALTALEARRQHIPRLAAAANGGPLMRRIVRLRQASGRPDAHSGWLLPVFVVLFVGLALASAAAVRVASADTAPPAGTCLTEADAGGRLGVHIVKRRMTVLEAIVYRLPASLRRELENLGVPSHAADSVLRLPARYTRHSNRTIWDVLFPEVFEITVGPPDGSRKMLVGLPQSAVDQQPVEAARQAVEMARREQERAVRAAEREMLAARREMQRSAEKMRQQAERLRDQSLRLQSLHGDLPSLPAMPSMPALASLPAMPGIDGQVVPPVPPAPPGAPAPPATHAPPAAPAPPPSPTQVPPAPPARPASPAPPAAPAPPAPPAPPAVPAPPAPPAPGLFSWFSGDRHGEWHSRWTRNGRTVEVRAHGDIELTDDDSDIRNLAPGAYLTITDRTGILGAVTFEARSVNGKVERKWSGLNGDAERRKWLADHLLELVRTSGFAAESRVARILKQSGPDGVLQEISRINSDYVKRIYFRRLFDTGSLDAAALSRSLSQAGREMRSAYDLASVLSGVAPRIRDDQPRITYLQAVKSINSDYERRRALSAIIGTGPLSATVAAASLDAATSIRSDYDLASVLLQLLQATDVTEANRDAFLSALNTIQSDYERRRVLTALTGRARVAPAALTVVYASASQMRSPYDLATVLTASIRSHPLDASTRASFFQAFAKLTSDYERRRVLTTLANETRLDADTLVALLQGAAQINSSFDRASVLLTVAGKYPLQGPARDAYLAAARGLSSRYEQDRALAALTRSEIR